MTVIFLDSMVERQSVGALALGSFDGVHLGHKKLLGVLSQEARKAEGPTAVLTFSPHPKDFFSSSERLFYQIYNSEQNFFELSQSGAELVFVKDFDQACSALSAQAFLDLVWSKLSFSALVVGFDFQFGKGKSGGAEDLKNWCQKYGVKLLVVAEHSQSDSKVSSTRIKKALSRGQVKEASDLLGAPYRLIGEVRSDQGLGRRIGYPTVNILLSLNTAIAHGVYASKLTHKDKVFFGVSNIGLRPTVVNQADSLTLETHILLEKGGGAISVAPGDQIEVQLQHFLRPEKKFVNLEELRLQIKEDVLRAQTFLKI